MAVTTCHPTDWGITRTSLGWRGDCITVYTPAVCNPYLLSLVGALLLLSQFIRNQCRIYFLYIYTFHTVELYIACLSLQTAVVTRESLRREVLAVVSPADEAGLAVRVAVTVPVTPGTGTVAGTTGPVTAHTETLHCLLTAVGGGGDAGEHLVTVVSPAGQISSTVAVSVAVSAPQTARLAGGAAGALASLPVTVLTRHVIIAITYHTLIKGI